MIDKQAVANYRVNNLCASTTEIGEKFGCTGEYIRQVLDAFDLPTRKYTDHFFICNNCGREFQTCQGHSPSVPHTYRPLFCSRECFRAYHSIALICDECGREFHRYQSQILYKTHILNQQTWFCSRVCRGKWLGRMHGFVAHPENTVWGRNGSISRL